MNVAATQPTTTTKVHSGKLQDASGELFRLAACVRAVQGGRMNPFSRAISVLEELAEALNGPIAVVGGLAAIHHGVQVTTLDVDVVVSSDKLDAVLPQAEKHGLRVKRRSGQGWHQLVFEDPDGDVDIDVIPAGGRSPRDPDQAPPIPSPQELGVERGLGYASFAGWAAMKLVAGRDKDRYHLIEALKRASQADIAAVVQRLRATDPRYLREFLRLVRLAEEENQENW